MQINPASPYDLWTVPVQNQDGQLKAGKPGVYLQMSVMVREAAFSPDGRWIAYGSQESGSNEIYVRSFPDKGGKWQISNSGGTIPIWSPSGGELFYYSEDRRIMVVNYTAKGDSFLPNKPRLWSETQLADTGVFQNYDIAPDGKRFVVLMPAEGSDKQESQSHVTFLLNFYDELRRRIPTGEK
jgi:serine/threonine-protein kinase